MNDCAPWLILFLPLFSAVFIALFALNRPRLAAVVSVGAVLVSLALSLPLCLRGFRGSMPADLVVNWLDVGALRVDFGLHFDRLSLLMLLVVTGVGSLIHIYSTAYMKGDRSYARFFASLSLFTFSMLGIVLGTNFFQMFIFWELVGVSSYLLIGFWYERASAADAAKKAFLTNRIGDFGFLAGIILVWSLTGHLNFRDIQNAVAEHPDIFGAPATAAGLLVFCGAVGKSAQFPLHVWLPDAMEGPTPVSALIHAATMVAAGVYMLCRVFFIFNVPALQVIAWIGGLTALMAALIACRQDDIKRILAYSTLSQLGYMVMVVGLGAPPAAMYHLTTHAFFKALLFLGAGSVIHAIHGEQDIWRMGRLKEKMPVTYWTFLLGTLALCGVPPLSGFYSKDSILSAAYGSNMPLFAIALFVALLTTFYMFRLFFVVFHGRAKSDLPGHAHESPFAMALPLVLLAVATVFGGFFGISQLMAAQFDSVDSPAPLSAGLVHSTGQGGSDPLAVTWTANQNGSGGSNATVGVPAASALPGRDAAHRQEATSWFDPLEPFRAAPVAAFLGLGAFAIGCLAAWQIYRNAETDPLTASLGPVGVLLRNKFYFDEMYAALIRVTQDGWAWIANILDTILNWGILAIQGTADLTGRGLRLVQTGNLQTYTFLFAAGIALALCFILLR